MLDRHDRQRDPNVSILWFIPASLVVWALYDLAMLLLGGRNAVYDSGWNQWNYVRWMLVSNDIPPFYSSSVREAFFFFLLFPTFIAAVGASTIITLRIHYKTLYSIRRQWLTSVAFVSVFQFAGLLIVLSQPGGFRFWRSVPPTIIPTSAILIFEIGTAIAWLVSPFLVYCMTMPLLRSWWKKRRILPPDVPTSEESHSR